MSINVQFSSVQFSYPAAFVQHSAVNSLHGSGSAVLTAVCALPSAVLVLNCYCAMRHWIMKYSFTVSVILNFINRHIGCASHALLLAASLMYIKALESDVYYMHTIDSKADDLVASVIYSEVPRCLRATPTCMRVLLHAA